MGNLIVKDNALIEASHRLSEIEQRLVLLAILKAREAGDTVEQLRGKELIIHADDYVRIFEIKHQMAYKALKKAVMGLFEARWGYKYINDKGNKVVQYERFTQSAKYIEKEGLVSFRFADAIIPMLVDLERRFTVYEIEQVASLSSQYAMRLYEFFMRHLDKQTGAGWLEISLEDLRFRFGLLPTEYKTMSNFKAYVLDFALKQINENTDLSAKYTQKKKGRTITGFRFDFKRKKTKKASVKKDGERDVNTIDLIDNLTDKERAIADRAEQELLAHNPNATALHIKNTVNKAVKAHKEHEERQNQAKQMKQKDEQVKQEQMGLHEQQWLDECLPRSEEFCRINKGVLRGCINPTMFDALFGKNQYSIIMDMAKEYFCDPATHDKFAIPSTEPEKSADKAEEVLQPALF